MALFSNHRKADARLEALDRSQAVIEFALDGTVIDANENFLTTLGYTIGEIKGRNHSMFVDQATRESEDYRRFWNDLRAGRFQRGEFGRVAKGGRMVWIQATYNPILDRSGKAIGVVKYAIDVTEERTRVAEERALMAMIDRTQAVISFEIDGTIIDANPNFLTTLGYAASEVRGRHHSMFVDAKFRESADYRAFWEGLRQGRAQQGEFKRIGKGGREVWIQATYGPVADLSGKIVKVVKIATDVSDMVRERMRRTDVQKVIDEDLGAITDAVSRTNQQAASAVAASTQTSSNVQAVAAGAEELAHSVSEISRQLSHALEITGEAVTQADSTNATITTLVSATQKIGEVVDLINSIAAQTNLLALNATIEAARAGEAGRGFAVVASEVKNLATQTSKATDEIGAQIAEVQNNTRQAVDAISGISATIAKINEISTAIASAVEEQEAVTRDMSENMQTAARGVETIDQGMQAIASATREIDDATRKVKDASRAIA